jgi:hypothetical protein
MQVAQRPYQSHFDLSTCIQPQNRQFGQYMSGWHSGIVRRPVESKFTLIFTEIRSRSLPFDRMGVSMDIWARTVRMIRSFLVYNRARINLRDVALQICLVAACRARAQAYWCPQGGAGKRGHVIAWTEMSCVSRHVQKVRRPRHKKKDSPVPVGSKNIVCRLPKISSVGSWLRWQVV